MGGDDAGETIAIVGTGRMGLALGAALKRADAADRIVYFGRAIEPPPHPLFDGDAAAEYRVGPGAPPPGTRVLILAVTDSALGEVAHDYARVGPAPAGCAALHLSGALSTDVLAPLHGAGYMVGSLHPMQAVADPWQSADRLIGVGYALGGEPGAIAAARRLVSALSGLAIVVPPHYRPLYHAAAVMASNYLVALLSSAVGMLGRAGIPEDDALRALVPLVRGTLDNVAQLGVPAALTGPIPRGDVDTVRLHLARLSDEERTLYSGLGLELVRLARAAGLEERRAEELRALLSA
jgi:predicted short-subunit dehydrogenase-like oxidoreductase (DUF2520 family)